MNNYVPYTFPIRSSTINLALRVFQLSLYYYCVLFFLYGRNKSKFSKISL